MGDIIIVSEAQFKGWIKEAIREYFENAESTRLVEKENMEPLVSRKVIASFLGISLVTLHDWMKRGLPSHKQRGRVYFVKSEVLRFVKNKSKE